MSAFEDAIWAHLVERHGADGVAFPALVPGRVRGRAPSRVRARPRVRAAAGGGALVLTSLLAGVLLMLSGSSTTSLAYALTAVRPGSYTVSLYDVAKGVPALNAKFAQLGLRITAVPVVAGCTATTAHPVQAGPGSMTERVTVSNRGIPRGSRGFIAAETLSRGRIGLALGTTSEPIPACFPTGTSHGIAAGPGVRGAKP